ncbi:hypothetical protein [Flavobacterium sp. 316]|uniref:hypothetical protein n=1 Tax=Flavobacterium sp. 316 TaxID=1603293 RepID=UPI0005FA29CE|nr:hypothetical protein [Flavobacterium sp. 316]
MKKAIFYILITFITLSCTKSIKDSDLENIKGYWEIEKVILPEGTSKEYKINEEVEKVEYNNGKGVKRKVILLYNGNFLVNNIKQQFSIEKRKDSYFIMNKTDFSNWEEEILTLSPEKLIVKNEEGIEYYYKKRNDIKLEDNGKKN